MSRLRLSGNRCERGGTGGHEPGRRYLAIGAAGSAGAAGAELAGGGAAAAGGAVSRIELPRCECPARMASTRLVAMKQPARMAVARVSRLAVPRVVIRPPIVP